MLVRHGVHFSYMKREARTMRMAMNATAALPRCLRHMLEASMYVKKMIDMRSSIELTMVSGKSRDISAKRSMTNSTAATLLASLFLSVVKPLTSFIVVWHLSVPIFYYFQVGA